MGHELDIRGGGVVAVDTASLRAAAEGYDAVQAGVDDVAAELGRQASALSVLGVAYVGTIPSSLDRLASRLRAQMDAAQLIAVKLRALADAYEIVELRAQAAVDAAAAARYAQARLRHPDAARAADDLIRDHQLAVADGLTSTANGGVPLTAVGAALVVPLFAPSLLTAALLLPSAAQGAQDLLRRLRLGTIATAPAPEEAPAMGTASGGTEEVALRQVGDVRTARAPADLADALGRIPDGEARIRIETYTMPDGDVRYAVYLAGTRDFGLEPGEDPWDMTSNLQLYLGGDAAAYTAVRQALDEAGVPDGASVYLFGHSQGGLIAGLLAVSGGYDARLLMTAGSPTEAAAGAGTLSLQLRHADDLVQSLAAGGSPTRVGAPGSLVVERTGDPMPGVGDLTLAAHHLTGYVATARMLDASADPRTGALRDRLGELQGARSTTAVEFDARRVPGEPTRRSPSPSPGPSPSPSPSPGPSPSPEPSPSPRPEPSPTSGAVR